LCFVIVCGLSDRSVYQRPAPILIPGRKGQEIVLKPDFAEARRNLGNALTGQGKIAEAVASYQRALALNPDYAEARVAFCRVPARHS
jgi:tetratricopeptide (TPR) repeat protein